MSNLSDVKVVLSSDCRQIDEDVRSIMGDDEDFWQELAAHEVPPRSPSDVFDWNDVDTLLADSPVDQSKDDRKAEKNRKRRLNEVERLREYSWARVPREDPQKGRYYYVNEKSGERETSLRKALMKCREEEAMVA